MKSSNSSVTPALPDGADQTPASDLDAIVEEYVGVLRSNISTKEQRVEAKAAIDAYCRREVLKARLADLSELKTQFVPTGWAGTHQLYQTGFDIDKRVAALSAELEQLGGGEK